MNIYEELVKEIEKELENYNTAKKIFKDVLENREIRDIMKEVNDFLVKNLGYNDHGIIHSLIVTLNSIRIAKILYKKGYVFEDFEKSLSILILSSMIHDLGNSIHRRDHQLFSIIIAYEYVRKIMLKYYSIKEVMRVFQCVISHQGEKYEAITLESKILAIADGLDMEEGRARYAYKISIPDIHQYSALAIKKVKIKEGEIAPIRIEIYMSNPAGMFQIENVLSKKINMASAWDLLEIYIYIGEKERIRIIKGEWKRG